MELIEYKYAEIGKAGSRMYVYFYAKNPETAKLQRKRIYLNHIKSKANRQRMAKKLCQTINAKLDQGWNPFIDNSNNNKKYTLITEALNFAFEYKKKYIRKRSIPNYRQRIEVLKEYLKANNMHNNYIFNFTSDMAVNFMNSLIMTRDITPRTYNNYLIDYRSFFNLLVKNNYLVKNPFHNVSKLPETEAQKQPFTEEALTKYVNYVKQHDYDFYIISCYTYYCALRPQEICRLHVENINLEKGFIHITPNVSKNKKSAVIPIAKCFLQELKKYLNNIPRSYYICGQGLKPSEHYTFPTRIAERFRPYADNLGIPKKVRFYSLKDKAAERLLHNNFDVKIIRDLFRHHNISVTNNYLKSFNNMIDKRLINEFPEI